MESDLVLSDLISKVIKKWWVVAALMIIGGLGGMAVTRITKPVYQSTAIITTAVDYAYAGRLEDYELDHILLAVGDIINSTSVRQAVLINSQEQLPGITNDEIQKNLVAVRKGYDWILTARTSDPESAQVLASAWADNAMVALFKMTQKSLVDFHTQATLLSIENCFSNSVILENATTGCSTEELESLITEFGLDDGNYTTLRESILLSNLSFQITTDPTLPSTPILFRQNLNVAAGALIGLILSLVWFLSRRK